MHQTPRDSQEEKIKSAQWFQYSTFAFDPLYTNTLGYSARQSFSWLNYRAWEERNLILQIAAPFLAKNAGISERTAKTHLKTFIDLRLISLVQMDRKFGNWYLIEPLLLGEFSWTDRKIENLNRSRFVESCKNCTTMLTQIRVELLRSGNGCPTVVQNLHDIDDSSSLMSGKNCTQYYYYYSLLLRQRYASKVSSGLDHREERPKGVLTDIVSEPERLAFLKAQAATMLAKENTVGRGQESTIHAQS